MPFGEQKLVDRFSLVVLPDVEALFGIEYFGHWQQVSPGDVLVIGDPDLSHDPNWIFPALAGARREATLVAELLGTQSLLGAQATRSAALHHLRDPYTRLIYLATHGISDGINPMDGSFLGLAEGHLYGRDIKQLQLESSPLVVMSACQTGLGKVFEGGAFGFARAWYHVGSPQIVMSLWNVDDETTEKLMLAFMNKLRTGIRAEDALRDAMLATREKYPDPALWASMTLFGIPSE
jgi:CHAT domain-containing protein